MVRSQKGLTMFALLLALIAPPVISDEIVEMPDSYTLTAESGNTSSIWQVWREGKTWHWEKSQSMTVRGVTKDVIIDSGIMPARKVLLFVKAMKELPLLVEEEEKNSPSKYRYVMEIGNKTFICNCSPGGQTVITTIKKIAKGRKNVIRFGEIAQAIVNATYQK